MEKTLTFFRVFDLAFFAPGTLLIACGYMFFGDPSDLTIELGVAQITIAILGFVAAAFCVGLVVHSATWCLRSLIIKLFTRPDAGSPRKPLPMRLAGAPHPELILYFWYLRATCWNVAFSLFIALLLALFSDHRQTYIDSHPVSLTFFVSLAIAALLHQGKNFNETLRDIFENLEKQ